MILLISCIDLIFTTAPNFITRSGVYPTLHKNCHHQITFAEFDFHIDYPPPFERLVWNYSKANVDMIQKAITNFNWENQLANLNVNEKVQYFNEIILNIFSNFCPSRLITCNDQDPPWYNEHIKDLIKQKNSAFLQYKINSRSNLEFNRFTESLDQLNEAIQTSKEKYYYDLSFKLNNPVTGQKKYWSILKTLLNGKKNSTHSSSSC